MFNTRKFIIGQINIELKLHFIIEIYGTSDVNAVDRKDRLGI